MYVHIYIYLNGVEVRASAVDVVSVFRILFRCLQQIGSLKETENKYSAMTEKH